MRKANSQIFNTNDMELNMISPKSGTAFKIMSGSYLKVVCPDGEQVSDLVAFNRNNLEECINNGKTFDYEETLRLTKGNSLYSNMSNKMLEIVEDTCGIHDFLLAPCCSQTMQVFYGIKGQRATCHDNLFNALSPYGIKKWKVPTAFNIFMNVSISPEMTLKVEPPVAKAGDYVIFKAHMNLIIGLTACSAGASNNFSFKKIAFGISETEIFQH